MGAIDTGLGKEKDGNSEEKGMRRRKKAVAALLVFMLSSLKIAFEREKNCLMEEIYFGYKVVIVQKSNHRYIFFTQQLTEI